MVEFNGNLRKFVEDVFDKYGSFWILYDRDISALKWGIPEMVQTVYNLYKAGLEGLDKEEFLRDIGILKFENKSSIDDIVKIIDTQGYLKVYLDKLEREKVSESL